MIHITTQDLSELRRMPPLTRHWARLEHEVTKLLAVHVARVHSPSWVNDGGLWMLGEALTVQLGRCRLRGMPKLQQRYQPLGGEVRLTLLLPEEGYRPWVIYVAALSPLDCGWRCWLQRSVEETDLLVPAWSDPIAENPTWWDHDDLTAPDAARWLASLHHGRLHALRSDLLAEQGGAA